MNTTIIKRLIPVFLLLLAPGLPAQEDPAPAPDDALPKKADDEDKGPKPAEILKRHAASLVRVEWHFKADDKGQTRETGWGLDGRRIDVNRLLSERRCHHSFGYLLGEGRIFTPELQIHPRFVDRILVSVEGGRQVEATVGSRLLDEAGLILRADAAAIGGMPLEFAAEGDPAWMIRMRRGDGRWSDTIDPFGGSVIHQKGDMFIGAPGDVLLCDRQGNVLGLSYGGVIDKKGSWRGDPAGQKQVAVRDLETKLKALEHDLEEALPRVTLHFRSPKQDGGSRGERVTEKQVVGCILEDRTLLMPIAIEADLTSRLKRIEVHLEGQSVTAEFVGVLKDWGVMLARVPDKPRHAVRLAADRDVLRVRRLYHEVEVHLEGDQKVVYRYGKRIFGFNEGFEGHLYPRGPVHNRRSWMFAADGTLVSLPLVNSKQAREGERWRGSNSSVTQAWHLAAALADTDSSIDPDNIPREEQDETKISWLGVELQDMDDDLARLRGISDITNNGDFGALVTYVYPDSPAARAGLKTGMILLLVHCEDRQKPIEVSVGRGYFGFERFPWARLDDVPDVYYDRLPRPWPNLQNGFSQELTKLGFGKSFELELYDDGETRKVPFKVTESPKHFDSADRHEIEGIGLTVRELTFEVLRSYQRQAGDPGVVVSKIKPGSKVAVAGLKPFEVITHVNGKAIHSIDDYKSAMEGRKSINFNVLRRRKSRLVKFEIED